MDFIYRCSEVVSHIALNLYTNAGEKKEFGLLQYFHVFILNFIFNLIFIIHVNFVVRENAEIIFQSTVFLGRQITLLGIAIRTSSILLCCTRFDFEKYHILKFFPCAWTFHE